MTQTLDKLADCTRCPRLVAHHARVRAQYPGYHASPVGAWGAAAAQLLIVGLAPGLHGAARTGRAFVGDDSGRFLFAALARQGFATDADPAKATLISTRITNVVKCLPPANAPRSAEVVACMGYLQAELAAFAPRRARKPRVIMTLGGVAHRAVCRALQLQAARHRFAHAAAWRLRPGLLLLASFHPSRLNVNTGRLNAAMMDAVLAAANAWCEGRAVTGKA